LTGSLFTGQIQMMTSWYELGQFSRLRDANPVSMYDSWLLVMMNFDNKVALWETTGEIIKDRSLYTNHGTGANSPTWTSNGKWWGAYSFDGNDDFVSIDNNTNLNWMSGLTLSAWINPTDSSHYSHIIRKDPLYTLSLAADGHLQWGISTDWAWIETAFTVPENEWTHVVLTRDGDILKMYANGWIIKVDDITNGNIGSSSNNLYIWNALQNPAYFSWKIDEVRIYNRALSAQDIQHLYYSNLAKYDTGAWLFSIENRVYPGIHVFAWSAMDIAGNTWYIERTINVNRDAITVGMNNTGLVMSSALQVSTTGQTIEQEFSGSDYFRLKDPIWSNSWYYTTITISHMTWSYGTISGDNIFFKWWTGITVLEGLNNPRVMVSTWYSKMRSGGVQQSYTYFYRNSGENSWINGKYANNPWIKITVPAFTPPGSYHGTIYFTEYDR
jgi:hypothetical protein